MCCLTNMNIICSICNKPMVWMWKGTPINGFCKGEEPYCTCLSKEEENKWKHCSHCGKELK